jgi:hypothetical protein
MSKFTDLHIRGWIKTGERSDMRGFGGGFYLCYREHFAIPVWRFRYRLKAAIFILAERYPVLGLAGGDDQPRSMDSSKASQLSKHKYVVSARMSLNKRCREGSFWRSRQYLSSIHSSRVWSKQASRMSVANREDRCRRRPKIDPVSRLNNDPGTKAVFEPNSHG